MANQQETVPDGGRQNTIDPIRDALSEVVRLLGSDNDMLARSALHFTVWDIAQKALQGEVYPWGYPEWRDGEQS